MILSQYQPSRHRNSPAGKKIASDIGTLCPQTTDSGNALALSLTAIVTVFPVITVQNNDPTAATKLADELASRALTIDPNFYAAGASDSLPDKVDLEEIKSYCNAFPIYLRNDKGLQGAEMKAMSVGSDPDGGYMLTPTVGQIVTGVQSETSPMRAVANIETIRSAAPRGHLRRAGGVFSQAGVPLKIARGQITTATAADTVVT
jgi:hypothetical protein